MPGIFKINNGIKIWFLITGFILIGAGGLFAQENAAGQNALSLEDCIIVVR